MQLPSHFIIGCSLGLVTLPSATAFADAMSPSSAEPMRSPASGSASSASSLEDSAPQAGNVDPATDRGPAEVDAPRPAPDGYNEYESNGRVLHYHYRLEPTAVEPTESTHVSSTATAADDGLLLPYTVSPRIRAGRSWVRTLAGYDSAASAARVRAAAESAATRWLAIRVEFEHGPSTGANDRVNFGGRVQLLSQGKYGVDLGLIAYYQPKDFRSEGNIVGGLSLGRTEGRFGLFGSALFGSDPERDDQSTDGRLSFVYRTNELLQVGLDNRFEYVLSTDAKRFGTTTTDWELAIEPTAVLSIGPLALLMEAGFSALQTTGPYGFLTQQRQVHTGAIAMAGASSVF